MKHLAPFLMVLCLFAVDKGEKPEMNVLLVGVDANANDKDSFAAEAKEMGDVIEKFCGKIYKVNKTVLLGKEATKKNFLQKINEANGFTLVYISAHGNYDGKKYYFLSAEGKVYAEEMKLKTGLIILDTCNAEGFLKNVDSLVPVITVCKIGERASVWNFVSVFSEGLEGGADENKDGIITFEEIKEYLTFYLKWNINSQNVVANNSMDFNLAKGIRIPGTTFSEMFNNYFTRLCKLFL